ncbi:trehalose-6-phosphate synthase [Bradyrhizobium sp. Arg68]|nr:trehalose-6-phosphate synthase [Bradyrhizobium ivorense]MCC8939664.1 trehalose-6-phosphate synthase [Bradyrhizobium ivorense]
MTLVVVSNRVASGDANEPKIGGLEAALRPVVQQSGAIWVGPSPPLEVGQEKEPPVTALGGGKLVRVDVPAEDYRRYYEGFANSALWPALHSRTDLINASEADYVSYRKISAIMARELLQFKEPTAFWVHDYHFLTLGTELRKLGIKQPIGFFLHTPWPAPEVMQLAPHQCELVESMLAYDLIGFQTDDDRKNFLACVRADLELTVSGDGVVISPSRGVTRCQVFPIGIDVDTFVLWSAVAASEPWISWIRRGLNSEKIAIGVDRIDYSKGIDKRLNALDRLWTRRPDLTHRISLLQIAIPSRSGIEAYSDLRKNVTRLVCDINSRYREGDWTPISYVEEGFSQAELASLYRAAKVALVTPLRDGMNLVAKEYVAAQDPADPGVLILSKYAGAAKELDQALLVDPNSIDDIADKISAAISMSPAERIWRWQNMIGRLRVYPIQRWTADFIAELEKIRAEKLAGPFSARDAGEPSGSKGKVEGKLAGGTSHVDLPRQLSCLAFDLRARRLGDDFTHIVGSDWNHGPQPAPDVLLGVLNRVDAFPRSFQPTTDFYIHGHPYMAQLAAGIREVTPNNPLGVNVILIPRLKGG